MVERTRLGHVDSLNIQSSYACYCDGSDDGTDLQRVDRLLHEGGGTDTLKCPKCNTKLSFTIHIKNGAMYTIVGVNLK